MNLIRTTEYNSVSVGSLRVEQRRAIAAAADHWKGVNGVRDSLLTFGGVDGAQLITAQYVGVVAAGGVSVEIFPKLDREVIRTGHVEDRTASLVMSQLVWIMHVSGSLGLIEADTAAQRQQPTRFVDFLAWLLGTNLQRELTAGVSRHYMSMADDLRAVRGKIDLPRQLTRNWDRLDRIACRWDEFSPDTPLNRVLKSACLFLKPLINHQESVRLLDDCLGMFDDVSSLRPSDALAGLRNYQWSRSAERFRAVFEFARNLLNGVSQNTFAGETNTFAWLINMNQLFQDFVAAAVRARYRVAVETDEVIGTLIRVSSGGIEQKPDLLWKDEHGTQWIGDAKYKLIDGSLPWRLCLDPNDVRQLTTYGGMLNTGHPTVMLVIFYPCVGETVPTKSATTWNGLQLFLSPVQLDERNDLATALSLPNSSVFLASGA